MELTRRQIEFPGPGSHSNQLIVMDLFRSCRLPTRTPSRTERDCAESRLEAGQNIKAFSAGFEPHRPTGPSYFHLLTSFSEYFLRIKKRHRDVALVSPKTEVLTIGNDGGMVLESNPKQQHCNLLSDQTSAENHFATKLHVSASPEIHRTQALDRGQPGEISSSRQMSTVNLLR